MIALLGMPRSGTTWVAKAIDSHPKTYYLHEPDSIRRLNVPQIVNSDEAIHYQSELQTFLNNIESVNSLKVKGRLPYFPKQYLNSFQLNFNRMSTFAAKSLGRVSAKFTDTAPMLFKPKNHVTFWKSIESMGRVAALAKAKPDLKIVMLVRHPCAVINSEIKGEASNKFSSHTHIYENWGLFEKILGADIAKEHELTIDKIKAMEPVERLAWRWLIYYKQLEKSSELENCKMFHYEELCNDPLNNFTEVFNFLGLPYDEQVKAYLHESTSSHSESYYSTSKDPKKAAHSWKQKLSADDIEKIHRIVGPYIEKEFWEL
ncbi:sulfotransferase [Flocculibacter collagenilyticus]|uniref:sulfotransferase n=1 Tax=Flocculibacter collagenilyticus TaxID=2744479 RepID=UPI0018F51070|nr:sulfotransferase [Flocculibacter collagenilyticus]